MLLNYQSYGQGPPLIILHGLFGMLDNWHTVSRMLAKDFHVFAVDQRNHGRSPHSDIFNYNAMTEDVREFISAQHISPCFLLGHSMGGKTAMWTALQHPNLIDRMVVVDIAPKSYPAKHDDILEALQSVEPEDYSSRGEIDDAISVRIKDPTVRQFLLKNLVRSEDGSFRWKMNLPVLVSHYGEIMEGIDSERTFDKPTLFVRGRKSSYIRDEDLPGIKRLFPNSSTVDFPTGHWVHAEAPENLTKTVTEFLRES